MALTVIKSSGKTEQFDFMKLKTSLERSRAAPEVALEVAKRIEKEISPSSHTKAIYRIAKKYLREYNHASGMRYALKTALQCLGPSGFPFERYFARILTEYGYTTEVDRIMDGYCVKHEVDIFARKGEEHFMVECKYHSNGGLPVDVKIALYVHARFEDIKKACELKPNHGNSLHQGWLVTNTRCTLDAMRYAECTGLKITSWRYPEKESLERLIEAKRLYPVTVLPSARRKNLEALFRNGIVLAQDIADMAEHDFIAASGVDAESARLLKREADKLCPCT